MAKPLNLNAGKIEEFQPVEVSTGAGDATKMVQLNGAGKFDISLLPDGVGDDASTFVATGAIAAGDIINIMADGTVQKADAGTNNFEGWGFAPSAITDTSTGNILFDGTISGLSGLTPGAIYYMDASTPGGITLTAPSGSGEIIQKIGRATSATTLSFEPGDSIKLV